MAVRSGENTAAGLSPAARFERYEGAFAGVDPPFAFVDLDAMWRNSAAMLERVRGKPIRVATKSLRCRPIVSSILQRSDGYRGLMTFTLAETLWLAEEGARNLLLAYPTSDREALRRLASVTEDDPDGAPVVMVDSVEHLDLIDAAVGAVRASIRVCLDFDASYWIGGGRLKVGPKRTPLHTPAQARELAVGIAARPGLRLVGLMSYEGHIAGLGDRVPGKPLRAALIARLQRSSYRELRERRADAVAAVEEVATLEFVNAGGTGDLELVAGEPEMTEATAGSGFYAPTLFDNYSAFSLEPAAMFVLPVSRRPSPRVVTTLGGGYLASGVGAPDRMPSPYLPAGLELDSMEGAGEVQTPLSGPPAAILEVGDRVYFRHAKAGELCERFDRLHLVQGDRVVDEVPTYRGEGRTFL